MSPIQRSTRWSALYALLLLISASMLSACGTLSYRDIQDDFNRAVQIDNQSVADQFGAFNVFVDPGFENVINDLSDDSIAVLDTKLRANAYMIRGVSQWRLAQSKQSYEDGEALLNDALTSARTGLKQTELAEGSRDKVMLTMLPALVIDTEIHLHLRGAGDTITGKMFLDDPNFEALFTQAIAELDAAEATITPATPTEVTYYAAYQRWRIIQNWRNVISKLEIEGDEDASQALLVNARASAKAALGDKKISDAAAHARDSIPPAHPLRQLIEAQ